MFYTSQNIYWDALCPSSVVLYVVHIDQLVLGGVLLRLHHHLLLLPHDVHVGDLGLQTVPLLAVGHTVDPVQHDSNGTFGLVSLLAFPSAALAVQLKQSWR